MDVRHSELLTSSDLAVELQVTPDRIRQLARAGALRSLRTRRGQRIFLAEDVAELKKQRTKNFENPQQ